MERRPVNRYLIWMTRVAIAGIFLLAGYLKVWRPDQFFTEIQNFRLLPRIPAVFLAFYLPWLEIVLGLALLFKKAIFGALMLIFSSLMIYLLAIVSAWARGLDISCGCFGSLTSQSTYPELMARNFALLTLTLVVWRELNFTQQGEQRK